MKGKLLLVLIMFVVLAFSEVQAQWAVWDCSTLPENTEMNGVMFTKSDKTSGVTDATTSVLTSVIDDPDASGNKLITINELDGDKKESWRNEWNITDPSIGITCVFRARPSDEMIAATKTEDNTYGYWYVSLRDGTWRLDLELEYPDTVYAKQADAKFVMPNPTDWHVIRYTLKSGAVKIYLDENPTPMLDVAAEGSSNNYIKYGETSTGGMFGGDLDWMIWDVSGAYAPGEGTPIPSDLISVTGVEKNNSELPASFKLSQNYPNPFNPSTKISFSLVKSGFTTLNVYNVIGQQVAQLVNKDLSSGTYSVDFDAANLPSGIYMYRINSGSFIATKKMMLIK
jgi:hypothetical protein